MLCMVGLRLLLRQFPRLPQRWLPPLCVHIGRREGRAGSMAVAPPTFVGFFILRPHPPLLYKTTGSPPPPPTLNLLPPLMVCPSQNPSILCICVPCTIACSTHGLRTFLRGDFQIQYMTYCNPLIYIEAKRTTAWGSFLG